ncbi:MAG: nitroreductase family protein [Nanoarchaeota archaeon]
MQLKDAIEKRHSVKKFTNKKPDWRDIIECLDTARYTPMAGNNFTLKFILVDNANSIQKLSEAAQQPFISDTQYVVVICSNPKRTISLYKERGKIYSRQQAGAAIQNILLAITEKKLATCWIGHFIESQIKRELKIPNEINIEAMLPIGYEFGKTRRREKIDLNGILYFKNWGNKRMKPITTLEV